MRSDIITASQSRMELALLSAEAEAIPSSDLYAWLHESGLPSEAAIRLKGLVDITVNAGGRLVRIGKIVLIKIIEFIKAHPNLAVGIALGAAIGVLVNMIPFLGTYLWPIATIVGVSVGAIAGHWADKKAIGQNGNTELNLINISQDVIEIARAFFELLIDIIKTALDERALNDAGYAPRPY